MALEAEAGDSLPEFSLKNRVGVKQKNEQPLAKGPLVIAFHRGEWRGFCNITILLHSSAVGWGLPISWWLSPTAFQWQNDYEEQVPVSTDLHNDDACRLGSYGSSQIRWEWSMMALGHDLMWRWGFLAEGSSSCHLIDKPEGRCSERVPSINLLWTRWAETGAGTY